MAIRTSCSNSPRAGVMARTVLHYVEHIAWTMNLLDWLAGSFDPAAVRAQHPALRLVTPALRDRAGREQAERMLTIIGTCVWLYLASQGSVGGGAAGAAQRYDDMWPAWSPDGRRIVFTSTRDGDPEVYVMNADGSEPRRLTTTPGRDAHPSWSPDGRTIAFQSPRLDGHTRLFLMNAGRKSAARADTQHRFLRSAGVVPRWQADRLSVHRGRAANRHRETLAAVRHRRDRR